MILIKVKVLDSGMGKSLSANQDMLKGELIFEFEKNFIPYPRVDTLCIADDKHQYSMDPEAFENFLNHSCNPNGYINFDDLSFRALRNIEKGEYLSFNYLSTEWDLANQFDCRCGSVGCFNKIKGFKYLTTQERNALHPWLSPFLIGLTQTALLHKTP